MGSLPPSKPPPARLVTLALLLRQYAAEASNAAPSVHEHYGPYGYLQIGIWDRAEVNDQWIAGPLADLERLATAVEEEASRLAPGGSAEVGAMFASNSGWRIELFCQDDTFDPATADSLSW